MEVGAPAGTILRITADELRALPGSGSVHEFVLADILNSPKPVPVSLLFDCLEASREKRYCWAFNRQRPVGDHALASSAGSLACPR
jgi:hypothetical protein